MKYFRTKRRKDWRTCVIRKHWQKVGYTGFWIWVATQDTDTCPMHVCESRQSRQDAKRMAEEQGWKVRED